MRIPRVREYLRRHGVRLTAVAYGFAILRKVLEFDVLRVETAPGEPDDALKAVGYVTREVTPEEFRSGTGWIDETPRRDTEFARGDRCFANFLDQRIVGYTFYGAAPVLVREGLWFRPGPGMVCVYSSFTHPDHRGLRLAAVRANVRRQTDVERFGEARRVMWYVALDNSASRAANRWAAPELIGHVGYVKLGSRVRCFASSGCREAGIGLISDSDSVPQGKQ